MIKRFIDLIQNWQELVSTKVTWFFYAINHRVSNNKHIFFFYFLYFTFEFSLLSLVFVNINFDGPEILITSSLIFTLTYEFAALLILVLLKKFRCFLKQTSADCSFNFCCLFSVVFFYVVLKSFIYFNFLGDTFPLLLGVFIEFLESVLKLLDLGGVLVEIRMLLFVKFCGSHGDMLYFNKLDKVL